MYSSGLLANLHLDPWLFVRVITIPYKLPTKKLFQLSTQLISQHPEAKMSTNLVQRVQDLPPELFNQIQSLVLSTSKYSADDPQYIRVTAAYEFPKQLQIDRFHRDEFATSFYCKTVFIFKSWDLFRKFVSAISDAHLALTKGLRLTKLVRPEHLEREAFRGIERRTAKHGVSKRVWLAYTEDLLAIGEPFANDVFEFVWCMESRVEGTQGGGA